MALYDPGLLLTCERRMARNSPSRCFEKFRTLPYLQDYIQKKTQDKKQMKNTSFDDIKRSSKSIEGTKVSWKLFSSHSYAILLEIKLS